MKPDEHVPKDLIDALFLVDEMATSSSMDALLNAARRVHFYLEPEPDSTPAGLAVRVWVECPQVLENCHAVKYLFRTPRRLGGRATA